jgi:hypothetical protein
MVQNQPRQTVWETLSQKYPTQNRAGGMAQVVKHLPSLGQSSSPSTTKKKKKEKKKIYHQPIM